MSQNLSVNEIFEKFKEIGKKMIEVCLKDIEEDPRFHSLFKELALFYRGKDVDRTRIRYIKLKILEQVEDRLKRDQGWIDNDNQKTLEKYDEELENLYSSIRIGDIDRFVSLIVSSIYRQIIKYQIGFVSSAFEFDKILYRYINSKLYNYVPDNNL